MQKHIDISFMNSLQSEIMDTQVHKFEYVSLGAIFFTGTCAKFTVKAKLIIWRIK